MEKGKKIIDGFAVLDKILLHYTECERNGKLMHASCEVKQKIADIVCETQPIDAVEVVHGKWIKDVVKFGKGTWGVMAKCSKCGGRYVGGTGFCGAIKVFNGVSENLSEECVKINVLEATKDKKLCARYCCNCGAKMDGEDEDD